MTYVNRNSAHIVYLCIFSLQYGYFALLCYHHNSFIIIIIITIIIISFAISIDSIVITYSLLAVVY